MLCASLRLGTSDAQNWQMLQEWKASKLQTVSLLRIPLSARKTGKFQSLSQFVTALSPLRHRSLWGQKVCSQGSRPWFLRASHCVGQHIRCLRRLESFFYSLEPPNAGRAFDSTRLPKQKCIPELPPSHGQKPLPFFAAPDCGCWPPSGDAILGLQAASALQSA